MLVSRFEALLASRRFRCRPIGWHLGEFGFKAMRYEALIKYQLGLPPNHHLDWNKRKELRVEAFVE